MKKARRLAKTSSEAAVQAPPNSWMWWPWAVAFTGLIIAWVIYDPALHGPFVFDDRVLPYMAPSIEQAPFRAWMMVSALS